MRAANYHRFYALLNRLACVDRDDMKETLVSSFTDGRTTSLKEMTKEEYDEMCTSLEERTGWRDELRKKRSVALKLMQKAGVDTTDWSRVNSFCRDGRICGKVFSRLGVEELDALQVKLRVILRKGGLRKHEVGGGEDATMLHHRRQKREEKREETMDVLVVPLCMQGEA